MEYIEPKPVEKNPYEKRNKIILYSSIGALLVAGIALTYYFTISRVFVEYDNIDLYVYSYRYDDEGAGVRIDSVKESATLPAKFRIPNKLNGRPVVEIASGVFKDRTELKSVHLPNQLKIIGNECFYGCENLESFNVPSSVTTIGTEAFENTKWLSNQEDGEVVLGNMLYTYKGQMEYPAAVIKSEDSPYADVGGTVVNLGKYVNMSSGVFKGQSALLYAEIPDSFTKVYESTFEDCDSLETVILPETLEGIGDYAFSGCSALAEANLPEDLVSIGNYAFTYSNITGEFNFGEKLEYVGTGAFEGCKEITKVSIPTGFEYLADHLFKGCEKLETVSFANEELSVESTISYIGENAFEGTALKEFHVPFNASSVKKNAFAECKALERMYVYNNKIASHTNTFVVDEESGEASWVKSSGYQGLVKLETKMFYNDESFEGLVLVDENNNAISSLTEVSFPVTISSIGGANEDAMMFTNTKINTINLGFDYSDITDEEYLEYVEDQDVTILPPTFCESAHFLKNIDFGGVYSTITVLNRAAFKDCIALESVDMPNSIVTIETNVFEGCTSLKSVNLSSSCASITTKTFFGCSALESISIPNSYKTIGQEAFANCTSLTSVNLGSDATLTNVGREAFANCTSLVSFEFPNTCDAVADGVFKNTSSLTSVTLSDNYLLTEIKASQFEGSGIQELVVPSNYVRLGEYSFKDSGLKSLTLEALTVVGVGEGAFDGVTLEHLYVPADLVDIYKDASAYSDFSSVIEAIA